ncbi:hypothetical protein, partial [Brevibacillus massiliensis]|uniref:hypothetical protein n=1 Tax=Brevibacillus massiliensis TaxID=1118054 RepID=UPI0005552711
MLKINTGCSFIHPVTRQMIHPGQSYEDFEKVGDAPAYSQQQSEPSVTLSLEDFLDLSADAQKQQLVRMSLA